MRRWLASVAAVAATALLLVAWLSSRSERVERVSLLMDTPVRVVVYGPRERATAAADAVLAEVARLESLWHPNRAGSDVVRVNEAAGRAPVKVAPETLALAEAALEVAQVSSGAFDPTVGPLVKLWGFGGGEHRVPSEAELAATRTLVGWQSLVVDRQAGTLYLDKPGMLLDLGGIAKGYTAGVCREVLERRGIRSGLVQLGGSVAVLGRRPGGSGAGAGSGGGAGAWQVAVAHPRRPEGFLTVLPVEGGFVDTAGDYQRFFELGGTRYHHILDPATGKPARGVAAVTVLTQRGEWADAYATAALVLGMEKGFNLLAGRPGVEAILVSTEGDVRLTPGLANKGLKLEVKPWP